MRKRLSRDKQFRNLIRQLRQSIDQFARIFNLPRLLICLKKSKSNIMKKFNYVFLLFFVCVVASCGDDDEGLAPVDPADPVPAKPDSPVLLVENPQSEYQGVIDSDETGEVSVNLKGELDASFLKLEIFKSLDGEESLHEEIEKSEATFNTNGDLVYEFEYAFEEEDANKEVVFSALLTDSLEQQSEKVVLVEAEVLNSMVFHKATLATDFPASGGIKIPYFLRLTNENTKAENISDAVTEGDHEEIAILFSANDGSGFYLSSPNAVIESSLVIKINPKTETKFKNVTMPEVGFNIFDEFDSFAVRAFYEEAEFGSNPERAEQVSEAGKAFAFKADNGQIGLLHVEKFETNEELNPKQHELSVNIWLIQ